MKTHKEPSEFFAGRCCSPFRTSAVPTANQLSLTQSGGSADLDSRPTCGSMDRSMKGLKSLRPQDHLSLLYSGSLVEENLNDRRGNFSE